MASYTVYSVTLAVVLFLFYRYILYPAFLSPLAKIPAANHLAKVTGLWILYIRWRNIENRVVRALHEKYGPIVRLAPEELSVNSYEDGVKIIYQGGFPKHQFYPNRFLLYDTPAMFTMLDNKQHSERKRLISHVYSKSSVFTDPQIRATATKITYDRLLPVLSKRAEKHEAVDAFRISQAYSMDRFMAFQFGLSLGCNFLQNEEERDWMISAYFSAKPYYFWIDQLPHVLGYLAMVGVNIIPPWPFEAKAAMEEWSIQKCDKAEEILSTGRSVPVEDQPALYAHFRAAINKWGGNPINPKPDKYPYRIDMAAEMLDHAAAAIETSGNTLTWLYYEMSRNQDLQSSLRNELMKLNPPIQFTSTELPDFKQLDGLPLLDAILQETLRCWPVVPGGQPRMTPFPGCSLAGYDNIPPNVKVHSAAGVLHRNPDVFPEPDKWDPFRWLNANEEQLRQMAHYFWAFGSGGRMCTGSNFALSSMKLMIASVYTNFTTTIVDADGIEPCEGFVASPQSERLLLQFHKVKG